MGQRGHEDLEGKEQCTQTDTMVQHLCYIESNFHVNLNLVEALIIFTLFRV